MRRIFVAAIVLAAQSCAGNTQVMPEQVPAGTYTLIAVDGQAVPHVLPTGEEIIAGTLVLKHDGGFEMKTSGRAQLSTPAPVSFQREQQGVYNASPIGVQLAWRTGGESVGAFFGRTLRFYHNGVEYLYLK